ncbi:hypothetical protein BGP77_15320 [Saccharospirillum sp. MSK14-1]|uniref:GbsR/MarR family transcriptional regulator n=1 Tax=Saccharospirillum sp. MSK14-1 TaxID=1897632 RepID=UPI000D3AB36D|nr:transcriptional regulator [Saccharospirillum sp. MSK14-1]PTY37841.1 hypothetical protein BGP77_15320 [Saccharospirillum sp. MSK14-1]
MTNTYDDFVELMGLISQADGEPRIGGRMFGLLLVEGRALTLNDFAERLEISKASASTNARRLASIGVIEHIKSSHRQDSYALVPDLYRQMSLTMTERFLVRAEQIENMVSLLPDDGPSKVKQRIHGLAQCYRVSAETARQIFDQLPEMD